MLINVMQILLSTDFKIGDIVYPKINDYYEEESQLYYIVTGYDIMNTDESGMVTSYFIKVIGQVGDIVYFPPEAIEKK